MNEDEIKQLTEQLKIAKSEYTKAKKILDNIESLEIRFQKASVLIESTQSKLEQNQTESEQSAQKSKDMFEEIKTIRTDISGYLDAAKNTIDELQQLKEKASELKGTLTGQEGEISTILKNSRTFASDIDRLKATAQSSLDKTSELFVDFQKKISEMQTAHSDFLIIKAKIDDKDTGLKTALDYVLLTQKQTAETVKNIEVFKQKATADLAQINQIKEDSLINNSSIKDVLSFVNEKKIEVEQISGLVIDGSFAETFEKRKREIDKGLNEGWGSWKSILLCSVTALVVAVLLPFSSQFGDALNFNSLKGIDGAMTRFFYTSPLIFLVIFSAIQYSKERTFLEKYAFKAASAAAIRNHLQFLIDRFEKNGTKEIMAFSVETFKSIYSEPFKEDTKIKEVTEEKKRKGLKDNLDYVSKDMVQQLVKLKDTIPDEIVFKQVIDFLVSLRK